MSSDFAQGHQCCSEFHEGDRNTSAQGSLPRVALGLMGYFSTGPQIPEGSTDFDVGIRHAQTESLRSLRGTSPQQSAAKIHKRCPAPEEPC
eukprot:11112010-Alexandrium_andersonii.AAC.1